MMPIALRNGVSIDEFESRTFYELELLIKAEQERSLEQARNNATQGHILVDLVAASVSRLIDNKAEFPSILDVYPDLFPDELREEQKRQQQLQVSAAITAKWKAYAEGHNRQLKGNGGN